MMHYYFSPMKASQDSKEHHVRDKSLHSILFLVMIRSLVFNLQMRKVFSEVDGVGTSDHLCSEQVTYGMWDCQSFWNPNHFEAGHISEMLLVPYLPVLHHMKIICTGLLLSCDVRTLSVRGKKKVNANTEGKGRNDLALGGLSLEI